MDKNFIQCSLKASFQGQSNNQKYIQKSKQNYFIQGINFFKNYICTLSKLVINTFTFLYSLVSRAILKAKYSVYAQNSQKVQNSIFSNGKFIFRNSFSLINRYLKFKEIDYFIHKFKMWPALFYVNFQQWNSNWDKAFFHSSLNSKLGFLNVCLKFVNFTIFFQFMKVMEYWDFWMLS